MIDEGNRIGSGCWGSISLALGNWLGVFIKLVALIQRFVAVAVLMERVSSFVGFLAWFGMLIPSHRIILMGGIIMHMV